MFPESQVGFLKANNIGGESEVRNSEIGHMLAVESVAAAGVKREPVNIVRNNPWDN